MRPLAPRARPVRHRLPRRGDQRRAHVLLGTRAAVPGRADWWDGNGWYRPAQVWDAAREEYYRRPVPSSATVTAADLLRTGKPDPAAARVLQVTDLDPDTAWSGRWLDHLSLWAAQRQDSDRSPGRAVVTLTAPELSADQMIGPAEVAEITGIAASTLRAYIARGESDVPLPQAAIGGRNAWARPVAEEWAEARSRDPDGVRTCCLRQPRRRVPPAGRGRPVQPVHPKVLRAAVAEPRQP